MFDFILTLCYNGSVMKAWVINLKNTCFIFAAGDFEGSIEKRSGDLIIAADAGYHHLAHIGISPDILLGDFDTIGSLPENELTIRFPAEKDYTDTELAIMEGIRRGYKMFVICGALGGKRLEHTIANIALSASYGQRGYEVMLTDGNYYITSLHNSKVEFSKEENGFISVFPFFGEAKGVSINGLKYPLENSTLDSSNPTLCVSNEFCGKRAEISVTDGTVIIIWQKSKD